MQLLVTDPTATHALRKSLLDCNTLVLSACGIEDGVFHRAPCQTPPIKAELSRAKRPWPRQSLPCTFYKTDVRGTALTQELQCNCL